MKALHKKGIFFTFIALTLMAALIIIFTPNVSVNIGPDKSVVETRVQTVNSYILDLENSYFENILRVSSHKAILALISHINESGFLTDLQSSFSETVVNGTIDGKKVSIMEGHTINDWLEILVNVSRNTLNINSEFFVNDVEIQQFSPWFIDLRLNLSFSVNSETASWNVNELIINAELDIENFDDPYYLANTDGKYVNRVNKTNVTFDKWNVENVKVHIRQGKYVHFSNSNAPSFLNRFTNDISSSNCCGIESLVNPNKLTSLGLPSNVDVSYVDYQFFSITPSCNNLDLFTTFGLTTEFPRFKLDLDHTIIYNISSNSDRICPPSS